jgi:serine/threonine-protein kinase HipA
MTPSNLVRSALIQIQVPTGAWMDVGLMHSDNGFNSFHTAPSYWADPDRPVVGQQFEDRGREWVPRANTALPRWFSHLLPEGKLRVAAADAAGVHVTREFPLLVRLGRDDLPGALRAIPATNDGEPIAEGELEESDNSSDDPVLKFSLAGLQMKFSVVQTDRGLTLPVSGRAGNSILKLPDPRPDKPEVPRAEHALMTLARLAGIDVAAVDLVDGRTVADLDYSFVGSDTTSLLISRFDRESDSKRVHVEELAQVLLIPTAREQAKYKYANFETVANYVSAIAGVDAVGEVIDRIVFNVLLGNGDAHLKNWAFVYRDGRNGRLSPAYDLVPTVLYIDDDDMGLNLNGSKVFDSVRPASFYELGELSGFGGGKAVERASAAVQRIRAVWDELSELMSDDQFRRLTERLAQLPLATSAY